MTQLGGGGINKHSPLLLSCFQIFSPDAISQLCAREVGGTWIICQHFYLEQVRVGG